MQGFESGWKDTKRSGIESKKVKFGQMRISIYEIQQFEARLFDFLPLIFQTFWFSFCFHSLLLFHIFVLFLVLLPYQVILFDPRIIC